jgi:hypothetical protein
LTTYFLPASQRDLFGFSPVSQVVEPAAVAPETLKRCGLPARRQGLKYIKPQKKTAENGGLSHWSSLPAAVANQAGSNTISCSPAAYWCWSGPAATAAGASLTLWVKKVVEQCLQTMLR